MPVPSPPLGAPTLDRNEVAALLARGRAYIVEGDVAAARLVLRRAVESGDAQAALALGGTYDPLVLKRLGVISFAADPAQAREWYRKAADLGSPDASQRIAQLAQIDR
jgi:TPR repeat protein